jgi:hypothetical protein
MNTLTRFRKDKDEFYKNDQHSPLTHEQKHVFTGLNYFPENPDLKLEVTVEEFPDHLPQPSPYPSVQPFVYAWCFR